MRALGEALRQRELVRERGAVVRVALQDARDALQALDEVGPLERALKQRHRLLQLVRERLELPIALVRS